MSHSTNDPSTSSDRELKYLAVGNVQLQFLVPIDRERIGAFNDTKMMQIERLNTKKFDLKVGSPVGRVGTRSLIRVQGFNLHRGFLIDLFMASFFQGDQIALLAQSVSGSTTGRASTRAKGFNPCPTSSTCPHIQSTLSIMDCSGPKIYSII